MRLTRAALRAESTQSQSIATVDASNLQSDVKARIPLGELSANALAEPADTDDTQPEKMPPRKLRKGSAKKGAETQDVPDDQVLQDERRPAGSPASDSAVDELASGPTTHLDLAQVPLNDTRSASPPSRPVRMTRRLAKLEEEELSKSQRLAALPSNSEPLVDESVADPEDVVVQVPEATVAELQEPEVAVPEVKQVRTNQAPEIIEPEVVVESKPEPKTLTTGKSCEDVSTPPTSRTPSRAASRSHSKSPMRLEESLEAIDALEEALDKVGNAVPIFDHSADEKSPLKAHFNVHPTTTSNKRATPSNGATVSANASKPSRNPSVIRSLKPPTMPVRSSLSRSSSTRTATSKDARKGSGEVTDYLASKRRPISMSFPIPPPAPKSSKPPTQSTFQLPGEAVAAKLKAQKEERLRREEAGEAAKQPRPISMPPRPKSTKPPTISTFQLPGEAVAAKLKVQKEERLRREAQGEVMKRPRPISLPPPPKSSKPPTIANFQLPGEVIAAKLRAQKEERLKREEEEAAKKSTFKARPAPARRDVPAQVRQTSASRARENLMSKENSASGGTLAPPARRTSTITPTINKRNSAILSRPALNPSTTDSSSDRNSLLLSQGLSILTPADSAALRAKAREQFLKDKAENESKLKERLSKEEAAKKAREEAAERGRLASREWAEKQKRKALGGLNGSASQGRER